MALQADMPLLDFEILEKGKNRYIQAIHAGDPEPMKQLFSEILEFSIRQASQSD